MADRLLVATRKGLFTLNRKAHKGKGRWSVSGVAFLGDPVVNVLPRVGDGNIVASLRLGHFGAKLRQSRDGREWTDIATPAFPKAEDSPQEATKDATKKALALYQVWTLESGGTANEIWAGCIPAGLFHSKDGGASWQLNEALWSRPERTEWFGGGYDDAGIHSILVDPADARRVTIGISCGGVWRSEDGGSSWALAAQGMFADFMPPERKYDQNIQDPHRLAACRAAPNVLWCQHHNAAFHSDDGARQWQTITPQPSVFGFAVAAHPADPKTAWFVPAVKDECRVPVDGQLVVARTKDGGRSFEMLREGLPQKHSYDLIYRHGLDVDESGQCLAMGSTTGGLWISESAGDEWDCVSTTLPPIYAVRFG